MAFFFDNKNINENIYFPSPSKKLLILNEKNQHPKNRENVLFLFRGIAWPSSFSLLTPAFGTEKCWGERN